MSTITLRMPLRTCAARSVRALVAALVVGSFFSAGGPVSAASADAWNSGAEYLRFPSSPAFGRKCAQRDIYLRAGEYRWRLYSAHWAHPENPTWSPSRWLRVRAGWYRWQDCLKYEQVWNGQNYRIYQHVAYLDEKATAGAPAQKWWREWGRAYGDGTYDYGSALLRTGN